MDLFPAPPSTLSVGPRERALEEGISTLGDAELLALLLGTGIAGRPATLVAAALLDRFAGLPGIAQQGPLPLAEHPGVGKVKALRVLAALELGKRAVKKPLSTLGPLTNSKVVSAYVLPLLGSLRHEEMWLFALDGRNYARTFRKIAQGGLHSAAVTPRDILRSALCDGASAMLLVHNHPSGDPEPSLDDITMTRLLHQAGEAVGLPLIDHVIVSSSGRYSSMLDLGLVPSES